MLNNEIHEIRYRLKVFLNHVNRKREIRKGSFLIGKMVDLHLFCNEVVLVYQSRNIY